MPPTSVPLEPLLTCLFTHSFNNLYRVPAKRQVLGISRPTQRPPHRLYNPAMQGDKKAGGDSTGW